MRQSACLVLNPITVNNFASLFNCAPVGRVSDSKLFILVGWGRIFFVCSLVQLLVVFCSSIPVVLFDTPGISKYRSQHVFLSSPHLGFIIVFIRDVICFPWWSIDELENLHADRTTSYIFLSHNRSWGRGLNPVKPVNPPSSPPP